MGARAGRGQGLRGSEEGCDGPLARFLRGGFFREFFLKYPESDHLHKRMLAVSRSVLAQGDEQARSELYQAQCNDPYWHGVFGGLYLPHLREAAYYHLLQAEARIPSGGEWQAGDAEADGQVVVARRDACFGLQVKPSRGGAVTEIDYYPQGRNLTDVLSRRPEAYHQRREAGASGGGSIHELGKALPPEAERLFRYDWHPRWCGLDHFLHPDTTPAGFQSASYAEQGDFINQPYAWSIVRDRLFLSRKGMVWTGDRRAEMSVQKEIRPGEGEIQLLSTLTNLGDCRSRHPVRLGVELLPDPGGVRGRHRRRIAGRRQAAAVVRAGCRISGPSPCRPCPNRSRASTSSTRASACSPSGV